MKRIFLAFLIIFIVSVSSYAQQTGCFKPIANNEIELETNIDFSDYNAFFLGEFHGVYGISEIKLALIKYLNQHYGITDLFMEMSYSAAFLYNAYLITGDTSLLINPTLIYYMKKPNEDFWEKLYEYNKGLQHKITIRGSDFERIEFLKVLKMLAPTGREKPSEIFSVLNYIDTISVPDLARVHTDNSYAQNSIYESIRDSMEQNRELYKAYYGANYKTVADIMFNENTYRKFDSRNKAMYHNIIKQINENGIQKFITFNGLNHGDMSYVGWNSLCHRLAKTPAFKNKLADIAMICKNCYDWQLQPELQNATYRAPATYRKDTTLINNIYDQYNNKNCKYTLIPTDGVNNSKVKKFSNFILLMKDQPEF